MTKRMRGAPAFQEFATDTLAHPRFRMLTLDQRGLLFTLKLECWVAIKNGSSIPCDAVELGHYIGRSVRPDDLRALVPDFLQFEGGALRCPELQDQHHNMMEKRRRQAEGGTRGATLTNKKRAGRRALRGGTGNPSSTPAGNPSSTPKIRARVGGGSLSRDEVNRDDLNRDDLNRDDQSEAGGTGSVRQVGFLLPDAVDREAWADYEAHRQELGKPMTDRVRNEAAAILAGLPVADQRQAVKQSVVSGWPGLFPRDHGRRSPALAVVNGLGDRSWAED